VTGAPAPPPAAPAGAARRVLVVAWDGAPFSLLESPEGRAACPRLAALAARGAFRRIHSVYPTVSSCAWASFMTGLDPGGHGIFGFVDRRPATWEAYLPNGTHLRAETLWERLSRHGKRVCVLNVPGTWPPRPVNGVLVGCFLSPGLDRISADPEVVRYLRSIDYRVDVDAWEARRDPAGLADEVALVMDRRAEAALHFLGRERWDFAMVHFMALDRFQHFAWGPFAAGDPVLHPAVLDAYRRADRHLGALVDAAGPGVAVMVLSDHGFCAIRREVQVNRWLEEQGWLVLKDRTDPRAGLRNVDPARSKAYSLIPGRIYLNLAGREGGGTVAPGAESETLRREIGERVLAWRDPDGGAPVVRAVLSREALYRGPRAADGPDLLAHPADGYDLKGRFAVDRVFENGALTGMHTFGDAFLLSADAPLPDREDLAVTDVHGILCGMLGVGAEPHAWPA
jgi:predicted AlkP superfamily phosphohydrolase/phosphomutase